ncbi:hypothetical protein JOC55_005535 [Paenibacillus sacheonensis]|nr:hypothetical protein [Paenibacillus sacheonensis]
MFIAGSSRGGTDADTLTRAIDAYSDWDLVHIVKPVQGI